MTREREVHDLLGPWGKPMPLEERGALTFPPRTKSGRNEDCSVAMQPNPNPCGAAGAGSAADLGALNYFEVLLDRPAPTGIWSFPLRRRMRGSS